MQRRLLDRQGDGVRPVRGPGRHIVRSASSISSSRASTANGAWARTARPRDSRLLPRSRGHDCGRGVASRIEPGLDVTPERAMTPGLVQRNVGARPFDGKADEWRDSLEPQGSMQHRDLRRSCRPFSFRKADPWRMPLAFGRIRHGQPALALEAPSGVRGDGCRGGPSSRTPVPPRLSGSGTNRRRVAMRHPSRSRGSGARAQGRIQMEGATQTRLRPRAAAPIAVPPIQRAQPTGCTSSDAGVRHRHETSFQSDRS